MHHATKQTYYMHLQVHEMSAMQGDTLKLRAECGSLLLFILPQSLSILLPLQRALLLYLQRALPLRLQQAWSLRYLPF